MKTTCRLLGVLAGIMLLCGCGLDTSTLEDVASDYANMLSTEDYKVFSGRYYSYFEQDALSALVAKQDDLTSDRQGIMYKKAAVYDKKLKQFIYFGFCEASTGFSNDVLVYIQLNSNGTKITKIDRRYLFDYVNKIGM